MSSTVIITLYPNTDPALATYQADLRRAAHLLAILSGGFDGTPRIRASWANELAEIAGRIKGREILRISDESNGR